MIRVATSSAPDPGTDRARQRGRVARAAAHAPEVVAAPYLRACRPLPAQVRAAPGVHPDDLKTLADLAHFPFTAKADLREALSLWPIRRSRATR